MATRGPGPIVETGNVLPIRPSLSENVLSPEGGPVRERNGVPMERILSPTHDNIPDIDSGFSKNDKNSNDTSKMEQAMIYIREYKGPVQFAEEFRCRYCGSVTMGLLKKGLSPSERRSVATHAVTRIGKMSLRQQDMNLRITDQGIAGLSYKVKNSVFFEAADNIQYLLAGRKNTSKSTSTYVLVFGKNETGTETKAHLLRFGHKSLAADLYHAVHRMIRDNMFANLFDIRDESDIKAFDPNQIQKHLQDCDSNIEKHMAKSLVDAMDKIDNLLSGNEEALGKMPGSSSRRRSSENMPHRRGSDMPLSPGFVDMMAEHCKVSTDDIKEFMDANSC